MRELKWQYKRNEKGALVRDKKVIIFNDMKPTTIGGLIKQAIFNKERRS